MLTHVEIPESWAISAGLEWETLSVSSPALCLPPPRGRKLDGESAGHLAAGESQQRCSKARAWHSLWMGTGSGITSWAFPALAFSSRKSLFVVLKRAVVG